MVSIFAQGPPEKVCNYPLGKSWIQWKDSPPGNAIVGWILIRLDNKKAWDPIKSLWVRVSSWDLYSGTINPGAYEIPPRPFPVVYAAIDGWCLVYSKYKDHRWLWLYCGLDFWSVDDWIKRIPGATGEEYIEGPWETCRYGVAYILKQTSKYPMPYHNLHAGPCDVLGSARLNEAPWWPDFDWGNPPKPKIKTPSHGADLEGVQANTVLIKKIKRGIVYPTAVQGDWVHVIPAKYKKGIWSVTTDNKNFLLVQWDVYHSGWLQWRTKGPVPGSHFVHVSILNVGY